MVEKVGEITLGISFMMVFEGDLFGISSFLGKFEGMGKGPMTVLGSIRDAYGYRIALSSLNQKLVEKPKFEYGFYWNYKTRPYFSILSVDGDNLKEEVILELDDISENFILVGDTLIISTKRGCFYYLLTYKSKKPIFLGNFENCNKFSFFA